MEREEQIRLIAYRIWEEDSCCNGHDQEHWLKAEIIWQELQSKQENQPEAENEEANSVEAPAIIPEQPQTFKPRVNKSRAKRIR